MMACRFIYTAGLFSDLDQVSAANTTKLVYCTRSAYRGCKVTVHNDLSPAMRHHCGIVLVAYSAFIKDVLLKLARCWLLRV